MEPEQIEVEPLVPAEYLEGDGPERLWERATELDAPFAERQRRCVEAGKRLCYLARIEPGHAAVGLTEIGGDHPAAAASGTDNLVAFITDRYAESPLVVSGPGAGPQLTAAGLFADILAAAERLGRR